MPPQQTDSGRHGSIRVLLVGSAGAGKTTLAKRLCGGQKAGSSGGQTVGCAIHVKVFETYGQPSKPPNLFFVELWDVSGQERYKDLRPLFYNNVNGVILVQDASAPPGRARAGLRKWAKEVAQKGTFMAPYPPEVAATQPGGLPVPLLVVSAKTDLVSPKHGGRQGGWRLLGRRWHTWWSAFTTRWLAWLQSLGTYTPALEAGDSSQEASLSVAAARGDVDAAAFDGFFEHCMQRKSSPGLAAFSANGPQTGPVWASATGQALSVAARRSSLAQSSLSPSTASVRGRSGLDQGPSPRAVSVAAGTPKAAPGLELHREQRGGGSLLATWSASLAKDGKLNNRRNLTLPTTLPPPFALPSEGRIDD